MSPVPELAGKRALVTGARGFIGSHLCDRLVREGADVHATSRSRVESGDRVTWWQSSLLDVDALRALLRDVRPDYVFHLAGHVSAAPQVDNVLPTYHGLLTTTVNLLTLLSSDVACSRIVLTGSLTEPPPGDVDAPPSSPYAAAKWAAAAYGRMAHLLYRAPVVITRPFMGYGPRQHRSKVIPYAIRSFLEGTAPTFGSGTWAADWVYVDDLVEGIVRAATQPRLEGETIDLGTGTLTSTHDVIHRIASMMHTAVAPRFGVLGDRVAEVLRAADVEATFAKLAWKPAVPLDEGLARTIRWFGDEPAGKQAATESRADEPNRR